jgi:hypothetical protein
MPTCLLPALALFLGATAETEISPSCPVPAAPERRTTTNGTPDEKRPSRRWPSLWLFRPDALGFVRQGSQPVKQAGMAVWHKMDVGAARARDGAKWVGRKTLDRVEGIMDAPVTDCIVYPIGVVGWIFGNAHRVSSGPCLPRSD